MGNPRESWREVAVVSASGQFENVHLSGGLLLLQGVKRIGIIKD